MSVQALGWVLDHSPTEGTERLVLLSLANHAGATPADGAWEAAPPIEVVQREANLRRERTVQEVLARLVAGGHIERIVNGSPDERVRGDRRPNLYRIILSRGARSTAEASTSPRGDVRRHPAKRSRGAVPRHPGDAVRGDASRRPVEPHGVPPDDIPYGVPSHAERGAVARHAGVPPRVTPHASRSSSFPRKPTSFSQSSVTARPRACASDDGRTDPRIEQLAAALGLRDHQAAAAANVTVRVPTSYLAKCVERWLTGTLRVVLDRLCADHPEWTVYELIADLDGQPGSAAASAARTPTTREARDAARAAGTACPDCDDIGLVFDEASNATVPCRRCQRDLRVIEGGAA